MQQMMTRRDARGACLFGPKRVLVRVKGSGPYEHRLMVAYLEEQVKDSTDIDEEELSTRAARRTDRRLGRR